MTRSAIAVFLMLSASSGGQPKGPLNELLAIGQTIQRAIQDKNWDLILSYEHPDWREQYAKEARIEGSGYYCFLIANTPKCAREAQGAPSIFEKFSAFRQPRIAVVDLGLTKDRRAHRAKLVFYDRAVTPDAPARSDKFVCSKEGRKKTETWHFEYVEGKWQTESLAFDAATDVCELPR